MLRVVDRPRFAGQHNRNAIGIDAVGNTQAGVVEFVARIEQRAMILRAHQAFTYERIQ